jgi:hypothetical protein
LGKHYNNLVRHEIVPEKTFIQRYFYRCCDLNRIQRELERAPTPPNPVNKAENQVEKVIKSWRSSLRRVHSSEKDKSPPRIAESDSRTSVTPPEPRSSSSGKTKVSPPRSPKPETKGPVKETPSEGGGSSGGSVHWRSTEDDPSKRTAWDNKQENETAAVPPYRKKSGDAVELSNKTEEGITIKNKGILKQRDRTSKSPVRERRAVPPIPEGAASAHTRARWGNLNKKGSHQSSTANTELPMPRHVQSSLAAPTANGDTSNNQVAPTMPKRQESLLVGNGSKQEAPPTRPNQEMSEPSRMISLLNKDDDDEEYAEQAKTTDSVVKVPLEERMKQWDRGAGTGKGASMENPPTLDKPPVWKNHANEDAGEASELPGAPKRNGPARQLVENPDFQKVSSTVKDKRRSDGAGAEASDETIPISERTRPQRKGSIRKVVEKMETQKEPSKARPSIRRKDPRQRFAETTNDTPKLPSKNPTRLPPRKYFETPGKPAPVIRVRSTGDTGSQQTARQPEKLQKPALVVRARSSTSDNSQEAAVPADAEQLSEESSDENKVDNVSKVLPTRPSWKIQLNRRDFHRKSPESELGMEAPKCSPLRLKAVLKAKQMSGENSQGRPSWMGSPLLHKEATELDTAGIGAPPLDFSDDFNKAAESSIDVTETTPSEDLFFNAKKELIVTSKKAVDSVDLSEKRSEHSSADPPKGSVREKLKRWGSQQKMENQTGTVRSISSLRKSRRPTNKVAPSNGDEPASDSSLSDLSATRSSRTSVRSRNSAVNQSSTRCPSPAPRQSTVRSDSPAEPQSTEDPTASQERLKSVGASSRNSQGVAGRRALRPTRSNESLGNIVSTEDPVGLAYPLAVKSVVRANRRRNAVETYTQTLNLATLSSSEDDQELKRFMNDFDYSKMEDDVQISLAKYPDSVAQHFKNLVPAKVSEEAFWNRYFYRCDEKRILREMRRKEALGILGQSMMLNIDPMMMNSDIVKQTEPVKPAIAAGLKAPRASPPITTNTEVDQKSKITRGSVQDRLKTWNGAASGGSRISKRSNVPRRARSVQLSSEAAMAASGTITSQHAPNKKGMALEKQDSVDSLTMSDVLAVEDDAPDYVHAVDKKLAISKGSFLKDRLKNWNRDTSGDRPGARIRSRRPNRSLSLPVSSDAADITNASSVVVQQESEPPLPITSPSVPCSNRSNLVRESTAASGDNNILAEQTMRHRSSPGLPIAPRIEKNEGGSAGDKPPSITPAQHVRKVFAQSGREWLSVLAGKKITEENAAVG